MRRDLGTHSQGKAGGNAHGKGRRVSSCHPLEFLNFGTMPDLGFTVHSRNLFGKPSVADSSIGKFFASIGAAPVQGTNLTVAMLAVVPVLAMGFAFFLIGSGYLARDQERARGAGGIASDDLAEFHH
jgi:hypothetical protein